MSSTASLAAYLSFSEIAAACRLDLSLSLSKRDSPEFGQRLSLCNKDADVLFLDGDRYVESGNITDLENTDYDINLLYLTEDLRDGIIDITKTYGQVYNFFFSCGIFFKRSALNKILDFQNNELFSEDIQEHWGIEDTYLGDVCYHLNLTCNYNKEIRLHGKFEKTAAEIDTIYIRLQKRDKLNVLWN